VVLAEAARRSRTSKRPKLAQARESVIDSRMVETTKSSLKKKGEFAAARRKGTEPCTNAERKRVVRKVLSFEGEGTHMF